MAYVKSLKYSQIYCCLLPSAARWVLWPLGFLLTFDFFYIEIWTKIWIWRSTAASPGRMTGTENYARELRLKTYYRSVARSEIYLGRTPLATMRHSPGGCAQEKGATGTRSYAMAVYSGTVAISTEKYTEGLHLGASGEGGSSLHGPISAMHRTQRAPFDEKHAHQRRP